MTAEIIQFRKREQHCSFCGRAKSAVKHLITSDNAAFVCDVCVGELSKLVYGDRPSLWRKRRAEEEEND